jgi:hypothetical protein
MPNFKRLKKENPVEKAVGKRDLVSFSFDLLHDASYTECKDVVFFIKFLQRLKKLCSMDWNTINSSHRHSFGYEKIPVGLIKRDINITKDINFLLAFRATGDNHAFLGFRDGNIFEIIFIESQFEDIYNH